MSPPPPSEKPSSLQPQILAGSLSQDVIEALITWLLLGLKFLWGSYTYEM